MNTYNILNSNLMSDIYKLKDINSFEKLNKVLSNLQAKIGKLGGRRFVYRKIDICINDIYRKLKELNQDKESVSNTTLTSIKERIKVLDKTGEQLLNSKKTGLFQRILTYVRRFIGNLFFKRAIPNNMSIIPDNQRSDSDDSDTSRKTSSDIKVDDTTKTDSSKITTDTKKRVDTTKTDNTKKSTGSKKKVDTKETSSLNPKIDPETKLWETLLHNQEKNIFVQMVAVNKSIDNKIKAEVLYELYIGMKPNEVHSKDEKLSYIGFIKKQLDARQNHPVRRSRILKNVPGGSIEIFPTYGDGTCGLHAMLGQYIEGYYRCDASQRRRQFCDWLRQRFKEKKLPNEIKNVLTDYYLYFKEAPSSFKTPFVRTLYNSIKLQNRSENEKHALFLESSDVFEAYLANLQKVKTYLLQDELVAAAKCFNKSLVLYQPGWGHDSNKVQKSDLLNPNQQSTVHIYYDGINHYEKVEFSPD